MSVDTAPTNTQLSELLDRAALSDLLSRHGRWLDEKRFDEARSIFTEDATVVVGSGEVTGVDQIAALALRSHGDYAFTHHLTTNALIDISGDRAELTAQQLAVFCRTESEGLPRPEFTVGERYRMSAVRTGQGWRLSHVEGDRLWRREHHVPA
ncbi:hypothetical protein F4561_005118 [Lipingzhangella halophila]|uniref:SnoaL-like domain-containing protein n=1 Tax=Lipingzhangella halophila TaxID=1783352 RepID=A0A7W7RMH1_9ACTN|nr:nuclear transport factor 2 family protein [Lipingzhangella halophila]MBB4934298.1 hypothetical protein [Lipingzhangella halophila]